MSVSDPALIAEKLELARSARAAGKTGLGISLERDPVTIIDLLSTDEGTDVEFDPERLGLTTRTPDLYSI